MAKATNFVKCDYAERFARHVMLLIEYFIKLKIIDFEFPKSIFVLSVTASKLKL